MCHDQPLPHSTERQSQNLKQFSLLNWQSNSFMGHNVPFFPSCFFRSWKYRVIFSNGPTQKSSKYGSGPTQQDKMAIKYTGPTQNTKDDRVFFQLLKTL